MRKNLQILSVLDRNMAASLQDTIERGDVRQAALDQQAAVRGARLAARLKRAKTDKGKREVLVQAFREAQAANQPTEKLMEMMNMNPDQLGVATDGLEIGARSVEALTRPLTDIAQTEEDFRAGRISQAQRDAALAAEVADTGKFSAKTQQYSNGTAVLVGPGGNSVVLAPDGRRVEGKERQQVLKDAVEADLEKARATSANKAAGAASIKRGEAMIDQLNALRSDDRELAAAAEAVREGAGVGPLNAKLPSMKSASIKLDNIQKRLGLNIISNTTFGALSEGELALALNTALPTNLPREELLRWIDEKRAAQAKLANYIEGAAIFMMDPNNTSADWLVKQRAARQSSETEDKPAGELTNEQLLQQLQAQ